MLQPPPPFHLRPLRVSDLPQVMGIELLSFPTPAKEATYRYELTENLLAHYQALTLGNDGRIAPLLGYAGYWLMADEVHVSIIAVDPEWRGCGLGELLLLNQLYLAVGHDAMLVTLEVRESNTVAQALYRKYDFDVVGWRRRYYRDTGEDAVLMTTYLAGTQDYTQKLARWRDNLFARLAKVKINNHW